MPTANLIPGSPEEALGFMREVNCPPQVIAHCRSVAATARRMAENIHSMPVNIELVCIGALIHDIGRAQTHSIKHAVIGADMARQLEFSEPVINIIERHVGAGITKKEAILLGLPPKNYCPITLEEKIVAHADNLTRGTRPQSLQECLEHLRQQSVDQRVLQRITHLHEELTSLHSRPL